MGGIILGMAQKQLLAQGTDLLRQYGIKDVIMIAPAPPAQVQGWRADPASIDLTPWTVSNDSTMGTYIKFPAKFTLNNCFKNLSGVTVPGAPVEYLADPILSANESMKVVQEIFGKPPFSKRPMVDSGIFDWRHGTSLSVIGFSQDAIYTPEGQRGIYKYLTGDPSGGLFSGHRCFFVDSPDAVHAMFYSNPAALISVGNTFH